ncbi:hypothetical protein PC119_g24601 [Phytophthora cactorum]|nr:hypothetical protein PC114_g13242 [Phytophthora cactorum]KAG2966980.1 hypothetical protein PC119_g24601 [Phytophthora cactorum]
MELKPELAQCLSKKKGKRQAVSMVNSVRRVRTTLATSEPRRLFENLALSPSHRSTGATGAMQTKRAESPIYSPTSPASGDKDADENQGRVVRSVNGVSVPVTPQQLQLQPAQAVKSVQPLQLVQPTQLMQSTQYVHHDVGVPYGWRAPAVGAVKRQAFEWIHLCQGITIKTATLSHDDAKDLKRDRMTEDCTEVNDKDLEMCTEVYLNEDTRLCLVEKSGENQYVGRLDPAGRYHVVVHHQEDQSHNGVATHHREALLDRSFVGVRHLVGVPRLGDVLCHDGHRRQEAEDRHLKDNQDVSNQCNTDAEDAVDPHVATKDEVNRVTTDLNEVTTAKEMDLLIVMRLARMVGLLIVLRRVKEVTLLVNAVGRNEGMQTDERNFTEWILDSGSQANICGDLSLFTTLRENKTSRLDFANGTTEHATVCGSVLLRVVNQATGELEDRLLDDVVYTPIAKVYLISMGYLQTTGNYRLTCAFDQKTAWMSKPGTILKFDMRDNIYRLRSEKVTGMMVVAMAKTAVEDKNTMELLHQPVGHLHMALLQTMADKMDLGVKFNMKDLTTYECIACVVSKAKSMSHKRLPAR